MSFLMGKDFIKGLVEAGIVPDETVSVVIKAEYGQVVTIYVQQYGDCRLLNVVETLDGAIVEREKPQEPGAEPCC